MSMRLTLRMDKFKWQRIALLSLMFIPSMNYYINYIIRHGIGSSISTSYIAYIWLSLVGVSCIILYIATKASNLIIYFSIVALLALSCVLYPPIAKEYLSDPFNPVYSKPYSTLVYCIPTLFLLVSFGDNNIELIKKGILKCSIITACLGLSAYLVSIIRGTHIEYMTFAYNMLVSSEVCLVSKKFLNEKRLNIFSLIIGILGTISIIFIGSRGAMICILSFFLIIPSNGKAIYKYIRYILLIASIIIIILNFQEIIEAGIRIGEKIGITQLRALRAIINNSFFEDSGRTLRINAIINGLKQNPIGYGLLGDWYCCYKYAGFISYAHNIVLELLADFGCILGPIGIIFIIYNCVLGLRNEKLSGFFQILIPETIIHLMFSGSFLTQVTFFVFLGFIIQNIRNRKRYRQANDLQF